MGKRIIQQARGKGGLTYRVRRKAFVFRIKYPAINGEAQIINLVHSGGHTAPLMKLKIGNVIFYNPAFKGAIVGEKIMIGGEAKEGNILMLKNIPVGTSVYNIEKNIGDGGKMIRTSGSSAMVHKMKEHGKIEVLMPSKKLINLNGECRATIGVISGDGRKLKPFMTAGRKRYKMKVRNKMWPRTSAVKFNAIDHPFGSGRGKRIKPKIAKRNAPPGAKVGHVRPRRTGRAKK